MNLVLIAAVGKNLELGEKNRLLWSLPADMRHFRETTQNATVIMGRKTFESIGKPLPKRRNVVLTRDQKFSAEEVEVLRDFQDILKFPEEKGFIIGGAEIYRLFLPHAQTMILTFVDAEFPHADAFFPAFDLHEWEVISEEQHEKDTENEFPFVIRELRRKK